MKRALFVVAVGLWGGGLLAEASALHASTCPDALDWESATEIGRGMKYIHLTLDEPRRMENYLVRIDLHVPGLRVTGSGRAPNWGEPMPDYTNSVILIDVKRQRTREFLREHRAHGTNMVLALNTSPWGPWCPPYTYMYGRFANLTVSDGRRVSRSERRNGMLVIYTNNVAVITNELDDARIPSVAIAHPGHGAGIIMKGGTPLASRNPKSKAWRGLAPRTAFGISADGRWLYGVVVDGRQPGYSLGADMYDLVRILKAAGAADAINMDGGGSATLAWWDEQKKSPVVPNHHLLWSYRP
ncbi:MAG: phosphodiester glycosidase family protein, partial [Kiritimatiellae bacterium]|nr:phosphodiester glycosidase family protein [Kiritimatiellia bacterium]